MGLKIEILNFSRKKLGHPSADRTVDELISELSDDQVGLL
jgi:hypothetical protein